MESTEAQPLNAEVYRGKNKADRLQALGVRGDGAYCFRDMIGCRPSEGCLIQVPNNV